MMELSEAIEVLIDIQDQKLLKKLPSDVSKRVVKLLTICEHYYISNKPIT